MPESTASRRDAIRHDQNRLLYGGAGFSAFGSFGASIVVMVSFAPPNASRAAWVWYATVTLVYPARSIDYRSFLRSTTGT